MKKDLHPDNYRTVAFRDSSTGATFVTRSTATTDKTVKVDGQDYPLVDIHISSDSHPFYTGKEKLVDIEGRVDKFKARSAAATELRAKSAASHAKNQARAKAKADKKAE